MFWEWQFFHNSWSPGTGKTTTLIGLIRELALKQKRILVCASSNHATDLFALKCMEAGLETVRIGNLSRIGRMF